MNRSIAFVSLSLVSALAMSQAAAQSLPSQLQTDSERSGVTDGGSTQLLTDSGRSEDRASVFAAKQKDQANGMAAAGQMPAGAGYPGGGAGGDGYGDDNSGYGYGTTVGRAAAVDLVNAAAGIANRAILTRDDNRGADLYVDQDGMIRNRERGGNGGGAQGQ